MKVEKNSALHPAEYLKSRLIDFFIQQANDIIIGNEVMYGINRRVVDLLILKGGYLIAVEIKSDNDDLRRLNEQIEEYRKIFDYIIICTTKNHLERLFSCISDDIGIYLVMEGIVKRIRKPKKQRKHDKMDILYTINANYLSKSQNLKRKFNSDEIRKYVYKQKGIKEIEGLLYGYLHSKIKEKYLLFLSDRGTFTHTDDIPILSSNLHIK